MPKLYEVMKLIRLILIAFIFLTQQISAQSDDLPFFQPYVKVGYGYMDSSKPAHFVNTEMSLYINSFGNTVECDENMTLGGCLIANIIFMISAFELSGGLEAALHNSNSYLIPKVGFYLRPLYFGKAGINVTTFGMNVSAGFTIPIKKEYMIELMYLNNFVNFKNSPFDENVSKYQLNVQLPLHINFSSKKSTNNLLF